MTVPASSSPAPAPTPGSSTLTSGGALAAFDGLRKGDPAPGWLHDGVCQAWGFPDSTTLALVAVSENATFMVGSAQGPVAVLRVARPGYMTGTAAFESEVAWVEAIARDAVARVPAGLPTVTGSYVAAVRDDGLPEGAAGWMCVCYAFVAGSILEDVADPTPYYHRIGAMTARLHEHARTWQPPAAFERHSWELTDMIGPSCRWGRWEDVVLPAADVAVLGKAQQRALAVLADAPRTPATWGLIHADLRPSNIIIDEPAEGDADLTVIDFDDCGWSWYLYDFAAAFSFIEHLPTAPAMAQDWVAGYREIAPFTAGDARTGTALSMIRRVQMLGWTTTHRSDALPPDLWDAQTWGTVDVAQHYLRSATWLLD